VYGPTSKSPYFRAVWQDCGRQRHKSGKSIETVKTAALNALKQIAKGMSNLPSAAEINELRIAQATLKQMDVSLSSAIDEYRLAKGILPHEPLHKAASAWLQAHPALIPIKLEDACSQYIKHRFDTVSARLAHEDELRLNRICNLLNGDLHILAKADLEKFFGLLANLAPKTRNHFRQSLRHFLKWCVRKDYLSPEHRLGEVLVNEKATDAAPSILTPTQLSNLLAISQPKMIPFMALGAFTGARRSEILRLNWRHIWRIKGQLELEADRTKTGQRRLVPIQRNLEAWLTPWRTSTGPIWPGSDSQFHHTLEVLMKSANLKGRNLLRHSYASYRLSQVEDAPKVALEMGHSVRKLFSNYRSLVTHDEAARWFSITPPTIKDLADS
jgi:integrase